MRWWPRRAPPVDEGRWVVVDVESSGLDAQRDSLLAVGAVALRVDWATERLALDLRDSFEVVLRQAQVSGRDNILLHGIGEQRQREGRAPQDALAAFAAYVGTSPLLAFHAAFDETLVGRAMEGASMARLPHWVDIAVLAQAAWPQVRARSLDEWMQHLGLECLQRHQAVADALVEAEVVLRLWPRLRGECKAWRDVERLAAAQRWLARG